MAGAGRRVWIGALSIVGLVSVATIAIGSGGSGKPTDPIEYPFKVICGLLPFEVEALYKKGGLERRDTPLGRAVKRIVTGFGPELPVKHGWRVLARTDEDADLGAGDPPRMSNLVVSKEEDGWEFHSSSDRCRPTAVSRKGDAASWRVDPADLPLTPETTRFTALVSDTQCSGGKPPTGRVSRPVIAYGDDAIGITFFVRPLVGVFTCQGSPPAEVEVRLKQPYGGRDLLNLGKYPPGEVNASS